MALRRPRFSAALPHGFSACGVFLPFLRLFSLRDFFVRASAFFARCVVLCRCWQMLPRLVLFWLLPSDISAEIVAAFFGGRLLPLQRAVFRGFPKGRLLAHKRWSFAARKDTFCTLKDHLFRKWLFGASGIASWQPSGQGRAVPRQGHPEGIIRGVRQSEILLLFIVRNIKFCLKVNLCSDFVSYYLSVGSNVFA